MADQPPVSVNVTPAEPSVRVNLSTIYDETLRQNERLKGIEGKLDRIFDKMIDADKRLADHEARLRVLEAHPSQGVTPGQLDALDEKIDALAARVITRAGAYAMVGALTAVMIAIGTIVSLFVR